MGLRLRRSVVALETIKDRRIWISFGCETGGHLDFSLSPSLFVADVLCSVSDVDFTI